MTPTSTRSDAATVVKDQRFAKVHSDPRFQRAPKKKVKLPVDERFKASKLHGLGGRNGVDNVGRKIDRREVERRRKKEVARLAEVYDANDELDRLNDESSESETSAPESESDDDASGKLSDDGVGTNRLPEDIVQMGNETSRLAIMDLDWVRIRAADLFAVIESFAKPKTLLKLSIYPSRFGLQRMAQEERMGPSMLSTDEARVVREALGCVGEEPKGEESVDESDPEAESAEDDDEKQTKIRDYELSRLRYFYAVAEFVSPSAALVVYEACDGVEFEGSGNVFEMRFVPDEMSFEAPCRDFSTGLPDDYQPPDNFITKVLQQSKVELSWDEDPPDRVVLKTKTFGKDKDLEQDLKAYLAEPGSSSDDEERVKRNREMLLSGLETASGADNDADQKKESASESEEELAWTGMNDESGAIWDSDMFDAADKAAQKSDVSGQLADESAWEARLRRGRERKKEKKQKRLERLDTVSNRKPEDDATSQGFEDDFFLEADANSKLKKKRQKKSSLTIAEPKESKEELDRKRVELELLMMKDEENGEKDELEEDDSDDERTKRRKSKAALRKARLTPSGRRSIAREKAVATEKFDANHLDPRFGSLFSSAKFALDPTHPKFKATATSKKIQSEKIRRRRDAATGNQMDVVEPAIQKAANQPAKAGQLERTTVQESAQDIAERLRRKASLLRQRSKVK